VVDCLLGVAVGVGEEAHGHEPPVAPLAARRTVSDSAGFLKVPSGVLEVSDFDVDLADPHVQVVRCIGHALAVCLAKLQCSLVQLARLGILIGNAAPPQSLIPAESLSERLPARQPSRSRRTETYKLAINAENTNILHFQLYRAFLRLVRRPVAAA
jgi:hypothetical protein